MTSPQLSQSIIDDLYADALLLADEARLVFDQRAREAQGEDQDEVRIALSIEGLKTTTRVMHVLAWLLNQRAYLSGDLSSHQLRAYGALPADRPSDEALMRRLLPETRSLIRETERLHGRAFRLDADQRARHAEADAGTGPVGQMHGRIAAAFSAS